MLNLTNAAIVVVSSAVTYVILEYLPLLAN